MFVIQDLVHVNATLNALSVVFLLAGRYYIVQGDIQRHRKMMVSALTVSALFLISYLTYKANSGFAKFGGNGAIRTFYFTLLATHVSGAAALTVLVPITVFRALKERFDKHKKIARLTWILWVAVGISGIIVYFMAVHIFPYVTNQIVN